MNLLLNYVLANARRRQPFDVWKMHSRQLLRFVISIPVTPISPPRRNRTRHFACLLRQHLLRRRAAPLCLPSDDAISRILTAGIDCAAPPTGLVDVSAPPRSQFGLKRLSARRSRRDSRAHSRWPRNTSSRAAVADLPAGGVPSDDMAAPSPLAPVGGSFPSPCGSADFFLPRTPTSFAKSTVSLSFRLGAPRVLMRDVSRSAPSASHQRRRNSRAAGVGQECPLFALRLLPTFEPDLKSSARLHRTLRSSPPAEAPGDLVRSRSGGLFGSSSLHLRRRYRQHRPSSTDLLANQRLEDIGAIGSECRAQPK